MYSNKSNYDYGQRRPHSNRGSRPWGEEDRREERKEPPRNAVRELYDKYSEDGHNRSERMSSGDFGEPYMRVFDSDTDWRKKRTSSQERSASEKRRRTLEDDDQYRYQHEPDNSYRQSPEKRPQRSKEFKRTLSVEEGYSRRRTPEESRYSQHQDEFHYSQYQEDSHYRPANEYYKDRDSRERSRSLERTRSRDGFVKSYTPPCPRSDSFSRDHEDHSHNRTRFSLNGSCRLPESSHRRLSPPPPPPPPPLAAATGEKKMSKGFQRFLDVLNMGVNVETLTKIVTQGSPESNQPFSPHGDRPWTAEPSQGQQNPQYWPQTERSHQRPASPLSRSYSSNGKTVPEERSSESRHFEKKFPSPTDKISNFDDEHKRKQVHDVLQAIGINLEFEELGQMSSRIQERLYGKKQTDSALPNRKEEAEREKRRQAYVPKRRSRSSSDSSSDSSYQDHRKNHQYSSKREEIDFPYQTDSHGKQTDSHGKQKDSHSKQTDSHCKQQSSSSYGAQISSTQHRPNPDSASMSSHLIPPPSPILNFPPPPYSNLPPNMPPVVPNMFMPQPPPFLPPYMQTPPTPPLNMFPTGAPASSPFPQPQTKCRRHPYLNLIMVPPSEYSNYLNAQNPPIAQTAQTVQNIQKSNKNMKRPRYLQHVETKK